MDIRTFNNYVDGYLARREKRMNDDLWVNHLAIAKLLQGIAGDRKFSKPIEPVKITEDRQTDESRNAKVYRYLEEHGLI